MFNCNSGIYDLVKIILFVSNKLEIYDSNSNLIIHGKNDIDKNSKIILKENNYFDFIFNDKKLEFFHQDENEVKNWVDFFNLIFIN